MEWDNEKTISQHPLNSNSLILGLLKTRDIANLSKKGIHHMMYPVHHMMYPVHHMMNPPIHHMMDGVHHMMDGVHHMMDLHYIIYCKDWQSKTDDSSSTWSWSKRFKGKVWSLCCCEVSRSGMDNKDLQKNTRPSMGWRNVHEHWKFWGQHGLYSSIW